MYTQVIKNPPPYDESELVSFELAGQQFMAISAGPYFKLNPSISLMVTCSTAEEVNRMWEALSEGGTELMALGEYPFSKRYAWVQGRYGLSWQLMLAEGGQEAQKITPNFLFSDGSCGKVEEAVRYYTEAFPLIVKCKDQKEIDYFWEKLSAVPEAFLKMKKFELEALEKVRLGT